MNIPIYRAKKIDSDEYVEFKYYFEKDDKFYAINRVISQLIDGWFTKTNALIPLTQKIDPTTLSIHFPDMLDSQGNKIFASLNEDGKGGDRLICSGKYDDGFNPIFNPYFRKSSFSIFDLPETPNKQYELYDYDVIGIQE